LKAQHLTSVVWLARACGASVEGAVLGSGEVRFEPAEEGYGEGEKGEKEEQGVEEKGVESAGAAREYWVKQNTAGSISLVLQALLPYLIFSSDPSKITLHITGGTNVSFSPSIDYITQVLFPMLALIGLPPIETTVHERGWTQGRVDVGSVTFEITPLIAPLPAFRLTERGTVMSVVATVCAPEETEGAFRHALEAFFADNYTAIWASPNSLEEQDERSEDPPYTIDFSPSHHPKRFYILLVATTTTGLKFGRDWLYDGSFRHLTSAKSDAIITAMVKKVGRDLVGELKHGGCVDEWMGDQVVVWQALSQGKSVVHGGKGAVAKDMGRGSRGNGKGKGGRGDKGRDNRQENKGGKEDSRGGRLSLHAQTAQWVCSEMLGVGFDDEGGCEGVGFVPGGKGGRAERDVNSEVLVERMEELQIEDETEE
jgi:RNA 3'-terminal phosphate cyclase (ATP)